MDDLTIPFTFTDGPGNTASGEQVSDNFDAVKAKVDEMVDLLNASTIVWGIVISDGTIAEGTGFTVTRNATGDYTITFSTAFSDVPAVTVTAHQGTGAVNNVVAKLHQATAPTATAVRVHTYKTDTQVALDASFHFHAIGPR